MRRRAFADYAADELEREDRLDRAMTEALIKAGIKNPPAAIFDADDKNWSVTIMPDGAGPKGEPPPGRPIPERVLVSKSDFKVTRIARPEDLEPSEGKGGASGDGRIIGN